MSFSILTLLASIGFIAFGMTAYFNYRIYSRMKDKKELTIEYLFLRKEIRTALKALIVANLVFIGSSLVTLAGIYMGSVIVSQAFRVGSAALFVTYMSFFISLYIWTSPKGLQKFSYFDDDEG